MNSSHPNIVSLKSPLALDLLLLALLGYLLADRLDLGLLFQPTTLTGGDSASWYQIALYLKQELIPQGRLTGWNQDNFLGYPEFQYYFIPPFLLAVLFSYVIPLTIALKIVSVLGLLLFPFTVYWALNHIGYRRPVPLIGAWLSLIFLFHERFTMFGGNALSTLAGEFSYSFAFLLQVIFMARLLRGQKQQDALLGNALLLALIGLSHAFVFLTAVFMPLFFWWKKDNCRENTLYLVKLYLLAFLLMAFWTLPMLWQMDYTTPVRMIWTFQGLQDFLATLNYEVVLAAVAALSITLVLNNRHGLWRFFLYMILVAVLLYLSASALNIPDIRFFPPLLFFCLLLITDGCNSLLARLQQPVLAGAALVLLAILAGGSWLYNPSNEAPAWWQWNLSGYETKPAFRDGSMNALAKLLKADELAARVAWEKSNYNPGFGSDRVFESLPLFTGRKTLEGIHYSAALLSKPLSWLLGEYSLTAASPEALVYAHYNPDILPARFRMFNISDIIVRSDEMKTLLAESNAFNKLGDAGELSVFTFNGDTGGYVDTPSFQPQIADLNNKNWRERYYAWFQRAANLAHPVVSRHFTRPQDRGLFPPAIAEIGSHGVMRHLESTPVPPARVEVHVLNDHEISFSTDSPGAPHIIKVAYSPNWRAGTGERIFPVSPGLMLVYPQNSNVNLGYHRSNTEIIGLFLSLTGLVFVGFAWMRRTAGRPLPESGVLSVLARQLCRFRIPLSVILVLLLSVVGIHSLQIKQQVRSDYRTGIRLSNLGETAKAEQALLRASSEQMLRAFPQNPDIPHAMTALAWLYTSADRHAEALQQYQKILQLYPHWMFIHQIYDGIAQTQEHRGNTAGALNAYQQCARIDRFSAVGKRCEKRSLELRKQLSGGKP